MVTGTQSLDRPSNTDSTRRGKRPDTCTARSYMVPRGRALALAQPHPGWGGSIRHNHHRWTLASSSAPKPPLRKDSVYRVLFQYSRQRGACEDRSQDRTAWHGSRMKGVDAGLVGWDGDGDMGCCDEEGVAVAQPRAVGVCTTPVACN